MGVLADVLNTLKLEGRISAHSVLVSPCELAPVSLSQKSDERGKSPGKIATYLVYFSSKGAMMGLGERRMDWWRTPYTDPGGAMLVCAPVVEGWISSKIQVTQFQERGPEHVRVKLAHDQVYGSIFAHPASSASAPD